MTDVYGRKTKLDRKTEMDPKTPKTKLDPKTEAVCCLRCFLSELAAGI